jgi:hypothetical protein
MIRAASSFHIGVLEIYSVNKIVIKTYTLSDPYYLSLVWRYSLGSALIDARRIKPPNVAPSSLQYACQLYGNGVST